MYHQPPVVILGILLQRSKIDLEFVPAESRIVVGQGWAVLVSSLAIATICNKIEIIHTMLVVNSG